MAHQYTKKLIQDTFIKMLNERPLKRITVKDLTIACDLNRNAFYYYYADIYELLSEIFRTELQAVIDEYNETLSWEKSFMVATKLALNNKTALYHVYDSMQREELTSYIFNTSGNIMEKYVEHESEQLEALNQDKQLIASFYQCALTGMVLHWIETGMKEDPEQVIKRVGYLFDGNIQASLLRSSHSPRI